MGTQKKLKPCSIVSYEHIYKCTKTLPVHKMLFVIYWIVKHCTAQFETLNRDFSKSEICHWSCWTALGIHRVLLQWMRRAAARCELLSRKSCTGNWSWRDAKGVHCHLSHWTLVWQTKTNYKIGEFCPGYDETRKTKPCSWSLGTSKLLGALPVM